MPDFEEGKSGMVTRYVVAWFESISKHLLEAEL
jgi:hypothetical protein